MTLADAADCANEPKTIRIMLADDHRMFRNLLRACVAQASDIEIVAETGSGEATLEAAVWVAPDILLLDIDLGDGNGIDIAGHLSRLIPQTRIIALSGHDERVYIDEMMKAGASGYVSKAADPDELIAAIRAVSAGRQFLSADITKYLVRRSQHDTDSITPPPSVLGAREREVLRLVAGGLKSAQIASTLTIAESTVEVHRRNIKQKLALYSTADLTRYAIRQGLVAVNPGSSPRED